jgi:hypothetical protein
MQMMEVDYNYLLPLIISYTGYPGLTLDDYESSIKRMGYNSQLSPQKEYTYLSGPWP